MLKYLRKILLCSLCMLLLSLSSVYATHVFGSAKDYANSEIIFYRYQDRITYMKEEVFRLKVDVDGNFESDFGIDRITYIFAEFGVYYVYFYAEPDGNYELLLPEYVERTNAELFNSYFEPTEMHLGIKNMKDTDLNYLIMDFDYYFNRYYNLKMEELYINGLKTDVDTFINNINARYKKYNNAYFQQYRRYRIAALKEMVTKREYESALVYSYYSNKEILYDNPAYMDLFNSIYNNYFDNYLVSPGGADLYRVITYGHSISLLHKLIGSNPKHKRKQFRELVMLKGLNDAFANDNLQWLPLLLTLDSLYITTEYPIHQQIAQNIADNSLTMAKGTVALPFELPDTVGNMMKLSDFRGKYLYLQFANTQTYSSAAEFDVLKRVFNRYKGLCIFVTILTDSDKEKAKKFIADNSLNWTFLFADVNSKVISDYKVRAYPTYYLIDPKGILVMSPAPSPAENFEKYLFKIIENQKRKK
ncbi:MAG: TlpA family protein disulfide reductase [Bacteroidales bacterium]|nr:TlpA family protein disulfide reductase [Bacteroidales bacterium]